MLRKTNVSFYLTRKTREKKVCNKFRSQCPAWSHFACRRKIGPEGLQLQQLSPNDDGRRPIAARRAKDKGKQERSMKQKHQPEVVRRKASRAVNVFLFSPSIVRFLVPAAVAANLPIGRMTDA